MKLGSPELVNLLATMDGKVNDELRLLILGIRHIDARIGHGHAVGYYIAVVVTAILVTLWVR
jgi:hypothetical protein